MTYKERDQFVRDLHALADFIQAHGVELPLGQFNFPVKVGGFLYSPEDARRAAKGMHGADKEWSENYLDLRKNIGTTIQIEFTVPKRTVCERKEVGTREIPEQIIEARTETVYEWECKDSLLAS